MQTLAKTIFILFVVWLSWLLLIFFVNLIYNTDSVVHYNPWYNNGAYNDVCYSWCDSSIYNECMGEEWEALERCVADKDYEYKVLNNYK